MRKTLFPLICLPLLLSGCEWADRLGSNFPVFGDSCEHWQCFTAEGRAKSDAKKRAREDQQMRAAPVTAVETSIPPPLAAPPPAAAPYPTPYDTMTPDTMPPAQNPYTPE